MAIGIEPTLYIDPQTRPAKQCPVCGGATYAPGYFCLRCGRWDDDTGGNERRV